MIFRCRKNNPPISTFTPLQIGLSGDKINGNARAKILPKRHFLSLTGFTLMELMIVIIILGIMVALAYPLYQRTIERSRMAEAILHLELIRKAEFTYYDKYNQYSIWLNYLTVDDPNQLPGDKYFSYRYLIPCQSFYGGGMGFNVLCDRTTFDNPLGASYYISMNQDGKIENSFYGP